MFIGKLFCTKVCINASKDNGVFYKTLLGHFVSPLCAQHFSSHVINYFAAKKSGQKG
jgi:hypothetical protein